MADHVITADSEGVAEVQRPTLDQRLSDFQHTVSEFINSYRAQRATFDEIGAVEPGSGENIFLAWNEVINNFLQINGFFDFVLAQQGMPTSGVVDMYSVLGQLQEAVGEVAEEGQEVDG